MTGAAPSARRGGTGGRLIGGARALLLASLPALSTACVSTSVTPGAPGVAAPGARAAPRGDPSAELRASLDPAVRFGTLANGLTYYVLRHPSPQGRAAFWLAVKAGSVLEDDDQRGVAHFIEHLAFRGTKRFPGNAIADYVESTGMSLGADFNGYASFDETVYQLNVVTDDAPRMLKGLDILRDIASGLTFASADVEKERQVVIEEWRWSHDSSGRIDDLLLPIYLRGSRYASRAPIGAPEVLRNVPPTTLQRFYKDWYHPERMAVIAVGDFADADVEGALRARFGDMPPAENPRSPETSAVPRVPGLVVAVANDSDPLRQPSAAPVRDR